MKSPCTFAAGILSMLIGVPWASASTIVYNVTLSGTESVPADVSPASPRRR